MMRIVDRFGKGRLLPGDYWHVAARPDGKFLWADGQRHAHGPARPSL